jgi:hypothetical protein
MSDIRIQKTGEPDILQTSDGRLTLSVPIQIKRRGGRKVVRLPDGNTLKPRPINDKPTPIQMALARGHRWLAMLESGEAESLTEVAEREGMDRAYVSRMVNLTTLAPDIIEAILDGQQPRHLNLQTLRGRHDQMPRDWQEQRQALGFTI